MSRSLKKLSALRRRREMNGRCANGFAAPSPVSPNSDAKPLHATGGQNGFAAPSPVSTEVDAKPLHANGSENGFAAPSPDFPEVDAKPPPPEQEGAAGPKDQGGRPEALDAYAKGKVVIALAIGLSHAQAGALVDCHGSTIGRLLARDKELVADLEWYQSIIRLHPFLRIFNESASNWKASAWLLEYLDKRHGRLTLDDFMGMLMNMWGVTRGHLPPETALDPAACAPREAAI